MRRGRGGGTVFLAFMSDWVPQILSPLFDASLAPPFLDGVVQAFPSAVTTDDDKRTLQRLVELACGATARTRQPFSGLDFLAACTIPSARSLSVDSRDADCVRRIVEHRAHHNMPRLTHLHILHVHAGDLSSFDDLIPTFHRICLLAAAPFHPRDASILSVVSEIQFCVGAIRALPRWGRALRGNVNLETVMTEGRCKQRRLRNLFASLHFTPQLRAVNFSSPPSAACLAFLPEGVESVTGRALIVDGSFLPPTLRAVRAEHVTSCASFPTHHLGDLSIGCLFPDQYDAFQDVCARARLRSLHVGSLQGGRSFWEVIVNVLHASPHMVSLSVDTADAWTFVFPPSAEAGLRSFTCGRSVTKETVKALLRPSSRPPRCLQELHVSRHHNDTLLEFVERHGRSLRHLSTHQPLRLSEVRSILKSAPELKKLFTSHGRLSSADMMHDIVDHRGLEALHCGWSVYDPILCRHLKWIERRRCDNAHDLAAWRVVLHQLLRSSSRRFPWHFASIQSRVTSFVGMEAGARPWISISEVEW